MKETFYFSHDYNARSDEKIKLLIRKHSMLGYGVYWSIIEDLYNNANALQTDYEGIAYDLRVEPNLIKSIILDFDLFVIDAGYFGSMSVQRLLDERAEKSKKASENARIRWSKKGQTEHQNNATASKINTTALRDECEGNAIKERKVKESKGKESKGKDIKENKTLMSAKADVDFKNSLNENEKFIYDVTIAFYDLFEKNILAIDGSPTVLHKAKYESWAKDVRALIKEGATRDNFEKIYKIIQTDAFWNKNSQSIGSIRRNYNKLLAASKSGKNQVNNYNQMVQNAQGW